MQDIIMQTLDTIETRLTESLSPASLAESAGYSPFHFARAFSECVGMPVMAYVTWRRLQHARYDLSRGAKVIDVAMEYGFLTHAGFTKAFKRRFGHPPSLCALRLHVRPPGPATLEAIHAQLQGGTNMHPHLIEWSPFIVVGWPGKHKLPGIRNMGDTPAYWDSIQIDYVPMLVKLHDMFPLSKHCEVALCADIDTQTGTFTYMLGKGIDVHEDLDSIEPDMTAMEVGGGLYAVFSTPIVEADEYVQSIRDTWDRILTDWLPNSEFEYDETRLSFEYYDHRDHGWYFEGKQQMDIFIPVAQRADALEKSRRWDK